MIPWVIVIPLCAVCAAFGSAVTAAYIMWTAARAVRGDG